MTASNRLEDSVRAIILGLMVTCIAISGVALVEAAKPGWNGAYLIVLSGLVAIEGYVSMRLSRPVSPGDGSRLPRLLLELGVLFCSLQLYGDVVAGQAPVQDWQPRLNVAMAWSSVPLFLFWLTGRDAAHLLGLLGAPPDRIPQQYPPGRRLAARIFSGGLLLFILAGLTQVGVDKVLHLPHGATSGPVANVFLYFLLGAVMLGDVQYSSLRQHWRDRAFGVDPGLSGRWIRYSLVFVALVAVVALLLPTGHTLGLLGSSKVVWDQVMGLLSGPLHWLLRLLGRTALPTHSVRPPPNLHLIPPPNLHLPPRRPPAHVSHGSGIDWASLIQTALFWGVALLCLGYMVRGYLRRAPGISRRAGRPTYLLGKLGRLWDVVWGLLRRYADTITDRLPRSLAPRLPGPLAPASPLRFRRTEKPSPRQQVIQYYLSMLRRAGRRGVARQPSQTPGEFDDVLTPRLQEAQADMRNLTDAFVEARYSRREVVPETSARALDNWRRVRAALRRLKG